MISLIYDRTEGDVREARVFRASGRNIAERLKGCYDHIDRNRVGQAVNELATWMRNNGYRTNAHGFIGWQKDSLVTRELGEEMLDSVAAVRRDLVVFPDTPQLPPTLFKMNHNDANALERILASMQTMTEWIEWSRNLYFSDITFHG